MEYLIAAALALGAYLVGGIPFGLLVAKWARGVDIRTQGSKNIGATNVGRVLGFKWGALVWFMDALKGFLPALAGGLAAGYSWGGYDAPIYAVMCGLMAVAGHNYPIYLGFKGGKGVSTSCGVFAYIFPLGLLIAATVWGIMAALTRYVSVASITAGLSLAAAAMFLVADPFGESVFLTLLCILAAILIIIRHRSNIERLVKGEENKIGGGKKSEE